MQGEKATKPSLVEAGERASLLQEVIKKTVDHGASAGDVLKDELESLGMKGAAKRIDVAKRLAVAYAKYGFVTQKKIDAFNDKLRKESINVVKDHGRSWTEFKRLRFTDIGQYDKIPPPAALARLREAVKDGIFDRFEVADIEWVKEVPDPIIFGRIDGCEDRFFIAQWDDDVKIEDIIGV